METTRTDPPDLPALVLLDVNETLSDTAALGPVLAGAGTRLVALTDGSADVAAGLLERGGVREHVEARAGLRTAWVDRSSSATWPAVSTPRA